MGGSRWLRPASAASRYALGACSALMAWALCARAPVTPGHCLALRARRRRRGAARPDAYMCSRRTLFVLLGGGGDVDDVVRCALLERLGAWCASSSCRGRVGWHELLPSASTSVPPPTTIALHPRDAPPAQVMPEEMRPRDKWSAFTLFDPRPRDYEAEFGSSNHSSTR